MKSIFVTQNICVQGIQKADNPIERAMGNKDVIDFVLLYIKGVFLLLWNKNMFVCFFYVYSPINKKRNSLLALSALGCEMLSLINLKNYYGLKVFFFINV